MATSLDIAENEVEVYHARKALSYGEKIVKIGPVYPEMYVCIVDGQGFYQPCRHRPPTGPHAVPK